MWRYHPPPTKIAQWLLAALPEVGERLVPKAHIRGLTNSRDSHSEGSNALFRPPQALHPRDKHPHSHTHQQILKLKDIGEEMRRDGEYGGALGGNVRRRRHCGRRSGGSRKGTSSGEIPCHLTVPHPDKYLRKLKSESQRDICILCSLQNYSQESR